jgi:hypothetical protein
MKRFVIVSKPSRGCQGCRFASRIERQEDEPARAEDSSIARLSAEVLQGEIRSGATGIRSLQYFCVTLGTRAATRRYSVPRRRRPNILGVITPISQIPAKKQENARRQKQNSLDRVGVEWILCP